MISICIPIYNCNVVELVSKISAQSELLDVPSEVILIDDCSDNTFKKINEDVCSDMNYIKLEKNIGRAAIRNQFLNYAKYNNLLFLDCDSIITSDDFLVKYIDAIKRFPEQLICGGREYPVTPPGRSEYLRWKYGVHKESLSFKEREKNPNKSFMTNNFLISRRIFEAIQFDERLVEYGHEDTLMGFELKRRNIRIIHIDNPILNGELEKNDKYIVNTEKAISNLVRILEFVDYDGQLIEDVTLLRTYYKFYRQRKLIQISFLILRPAIKYFLSRGVVNLDLFDFYKLGTLAVKMNVSQKKI